VIAEHCLVERDGHLLTVTLNRPEAKNAFSGEMMAGIYRAWRMLDEDPELRVAILTGGSDVFCAGAGPVFASKHAREGPRAFAEKRKPVYQGEWREVTRRRRRCPPRSI
jgi:enoyl-CoA hydratase